MGNPLELRLIAVEKRLAAFERKLRSGTKARPMWKTHIGWAKDDPFYDKAMKLGAAYRKRS